MFWSKKGEDLSQKFNEIYSRLVSFYDENSISSERREYLREIVSKNGYLPYPYYKALEELTDCETLFALKIKWEKSGVLKDGRFEFDNASVLSRCKISNSDWIKREGHDIKLINLSALGNHTDSAGKFFDWLKQLLILPSGNLENNIFNTTIYLVPFQQREFGCAYLPKSSEVSEELLDKDLKERFGLDVKSQVKLFIQMAQLAGHPVIYDILPQTSRFAKSVLANPYIARWYDIETLQKQIDEKVDDVAKDMANDYDLEDVEAVKEIYLQGGGDLSEYYKNIYDEFEKRVLDYKITLSNAMLEKKSQQNIIKKVEKIIIEAEGGKKKLTEDNIDNQLKIVKTLMDKGFWTACGGAWCSAGVPVYDRMSECNSYPVFKHFDYKGEDVSHLANLDCQTPYYFVCLENGVYNKPVIDYFVNYMSKLQAEYNFDGFRVDHVDHVVDNISEKDGMPISYRIPKKVLAELNKTLKKKIPYFATLAEYMLWDKFYSEYHTGMGFDLLWGDDIVCQNDKTPLKVVEDNQFLTNYNLQLKNYLSVLKTYNNQDGEFDCINQYPAKLGREGALFKFFMYKFLPGGRHAQRPLLYVDGDESFTQNGMAKSISCEISMKRNDDMEFFEKFMAIDNFVKNNQVITDGEAQIIVQDDDGFVAWIISKEPLKKAYLVVANFGDNEVYDKTVNLPADYDVVTELNINRYEFEKNGNNKLSFEILINKEFKIFEIKKY